MKLDFTKLKRREETYFYNFFGLLFCSSESRFSSLISFFLLLENDSFRLPYICFQNLCHNFHKYVSCNGLTWIFVSFINLLFCISGPSQSTCSLLILFIVTFCDSNSMNIRYFLVFIHCSTLLFYYLGISLTESFLLFYFPVYWLPPPVF